jgi:hypothetical protein
MDKIEPGAINFSAGWFGVGHEVCILFLSEFRFNLTASSLVMRISPLALAKPQISKSIGNVKLASNVRRCGKIHKSNPIFD